MNPKRNKRIYIIGAGFTGTAIAREIARKGILGEVVAFLDDDPGKIGSSIEGVPVLGPISAVVALLKQTPADEAIIAMPSASQEYLRELYLVLKRAGFQRIRIVPNVSQILEGDAHLIQAREIAPQDLLGRKPLTVNLKKSISYLRGKRVLITGAGGSIGSELARQLLSGGADRLYLFGHGENSIYEIDRELRILQEEGVGEKATIVPVIGELQDEDYMRFLLPRLKADVVFHCAAHKHVPLMEANPVEAIKNNVFGTYHLVQAARDAAVRRFVLISTDKTVEPRSVYGASKKIAEEIVLAAGVENAAFMVVRFGNVLGSRGSIVPLFTRQILKGGPVTITDPRTSRFFMTLPEAASLVLKTGGVGENGMLYLLDMGEPIMIKDLIEHMIRFYGFEPEKDIPIVPIGLRGGEKLNERLWSPEETVTPTDDPAVNRIVRDAPAIAGLDSLLRDLRPLCYAERSRAEAFRNRRLLKEILKRAIPTIEISAHEPPY